MATTTRRVSLTPKLRKEYEDLFATCAVNPGRQRAVNSLTAKIVENRGRYEEIERETGVPWYVVAALHSLEASLRFTRHLHNGDPLSAKTVRVPKGRPPGTPPFTWKVSALDALKVDKLTEVRKWDLATTLFSFEKFNGFGYRTRNTGINTPYLWSFSNHYRKGKFTADKKFDPNAVSQQCGAAVILKALSEGGAIKIPLG